jgi:hypothetical protein
VVRIFAILFTLFALVVPALAQDAPTAIGNAETVLASIPNTVQVYDNSMRYRGDLYLDEVTSIVDRIDLTEDGYQGPVVSTEFCGNFNTGIRNPGRNRTGLQGVCPVEHSYLVFPTDEPEWEWDTITFIFGQGEYDGEWFAVFADYNFPYFNSHRSQWHRRPELQELSHNAVPHPITGAFRMYFNITLGDWQKIYRLARSRVYADFDATMDAMEAMQATAIAEMPPLVTDYVPRNRR